MKIIQNDSEQTIKMGKIQVTCKDSVITKKIHSFSEILKDGVQIKNLKRAISIG